MSKKRLILYAIFAWMFFSFVPAHGAERHVAIAQDGFAEKIALFLTNPIVVTILLTLISLGFVLELYTPGFGIYGFIGLISLVLYFYSHIVTGMAGFNSILLFIIGVVLIIAEIFLPGAIAGFLGILAVIGSFLLAGGNFMYTAVSICIALMITIIAMIIMVKVFGKRMKLFKKIVLSDSVNTKDGYVSNINRTDLIGLTGNTITPLRPAGTMEIKGERLDVVTEGGYIDRGVKVKVIKVEGPRIVVRIQSETEIFD